MRVAIVLAGGDPVEPHVRSKLPSDGYVVAADSGLHLGVPLGLHVDLVVGDFDSADPAAVDRAIEAGANIDRHPAAKDATDLELALDAALAWNPDRIIVVGGNGGRLDHLLGNVTLLAAPRLRDVAVDAWMGDAHVAVVRGGQRAVEFDARIGEVLTLLPLGGAARGVTTTGLEYPLRLEDLEPGTTRGVSNVVVARPASVALDAGTLLAVRPEGGIE
jgi:thiamine pyrophosphokinase